MDEGRGADKTKNVIVFSITNPNASEFLFKPWRVVLFANHTEHVAQKCIKYR